VSPTILHGEPVASARRERVADRVADLRSRGVEPTLGTVLVGESSAGHRFMELKHEACRAVGIASRDRRLPADAPAGALADTVAELSDDKVVDAVFVQTPLPAEVDVAAARRRLDPTADVDCFHPETLGQLVLGRPRFVPATTGAVCRLLDHYDIALQGQHVVVVGRTTTIGKPLANHLLRRAAPGNATVTVCHSKTRDLSARTRDADVLVTAAGKPGLVDGSMLAAGVAVLDVSANRSVVDGEVRVVGDVDYESALETAGAITPVPGGVGPVTIEMLLSNVATAAARGEADTHSA